MSTRILMATAASIALAVSAAAQEQQKPLETEQQTGQQLERAQETLQEESGEGAAATAQTEAPAQPTEADQPPVGEGEQLAEEEEATPPPDMAFIEVQDQAQFLAEDEVIGKDVVNVQEEEVGTIADLVMDQDQKLVGVVLSVGGFLGIGEKWVAIPVDQIDFPSDEQPARLRVAVTEDQLKNAPDFMTREQVEAEQAAQQAQQQAIEQQPQVPSPTTTPAQ